MGFQQIPASRASLSLLRAWGRHVLARLVGCLAWKKAGIVEISWGKCDFKITRVFFFGRDWWHTCSFGTYSFIPPSTIILNSSTWWSEHGHWVIWGTTPAIMALHGFHGRCVAKLCSFSDFCSFFCSRTLGLELLKNPRMLEWLLFIGISKSCLMFSFFCPHL